MHLLYRIAVGLGSIALGALILRFKFPASAYRDWEDRPWAWQARFGNTCAGLLAVGFGIWALVAAP